MSHPIRYLSKRPVDRHGLLVIMQGNSNSNSNSNNNINNNESHEDVPRLITSLADSLQLTPMTYNDFTECVLRRQRL